MRNFQRFPPEEGGASGAGAAGATSTFSMGFVGGSDAGQGDDGDAAGSSAGGGDGEAARLLSSAIARSKPGASGASTYHSPELGSSHQVRPSASSVKRNPPA